MLATRGAKRSENLEDKIVTTYKQFGAKLIEAHGRLATVNEANNISWVVPKNTVVIFLAKPGRCMFIGAGRILAQQYFRNNSDIVNFFKGKAARAGLHHGEILSRTFFENEMCPNVSLEFKNNSFPSFGYVWKLPLMRSRTVTANNLALEPAPLRTEIYNKINHGTTLQIKSVIDKLGPGVYIVNACLPPGNFRTNVGAGINAPKKESNWNKGRESARTREHIRYESYIKKSIRPPRPGSRTHTHLPPNYGYKIRQPKLLARPSLTIQQILYRLSRNPNMNLNQNFKKLRANVNTSRLIRVQNILKEPTSFVKSLSGPARLQWRLSRNRARFIHNRLGTNLNIKTIKV
jgi:hypothetical protein